MSQLRRRQPCRRLLVPSCTRSSHQTCPRQRVQRVPGPLAFGPAWLASWGWRARSRVEGGGSPSDTGYPRWWGTSSSGAKRTARGHSRGTSGKSGPWWPGTQKQNLLGTIAHHLLFKGANMIVISKKKVVFIIFADELCKETSRD